MRFHIQIIYFPYSGFMLLCTPILFRFAVLSEREGRKSGLDGWILEKLFTLSFFSKLFNITPLETLGESVQCMGRSFDFGHHA